MDQPRWLEIAWAERGQREIAGKADNARILAYYRDAGHPEVAHDETAWCAAFVGACLVRAGERGTGSLMARSYLGWGERLDAPRVGAVGVLPRGDDPTAGHVGFVVGAQAADVLLLAGNQGDAVSVATYPRTRFLGFRWPAAASSAATAGALVASAGSVFDAALAHVLKMEGGWTDDPYDPGGPTNFGVTLADYARHRGIDVQADNIAALKQELRAISVDTVRTIYLERYWTPCRAGDLPGGLALMHFDAAVNQGVGTAARMLQQAVGADIDGEIGSLTLDAARTMPAERALEAYADARRSRYRALPLFWRFGRGWLARVAATLARSRAVATVPPSASPPIKKDAAMTDQAPLQSQQQPASAAGQPAKWWGESLTIWGALLTGLTTVLPLIGPLLGLDITGEMARQLGEAAVQAAQAVGGLAGLLMTIYGRTRAATKLERRDVSVRI